MKKLISIILVAVMFFSFTSICASAEEPAPAPDLSYTKEVEVKLTSDHRLTSPDGNGFDVLIETDTKNIVAFDGFTTQHTAEIVKVEAKKDGAPRVEYDKNYVSENPDDENAINPFFKYFAVPEGEEAKAIHLYITYKIDFVDAEVVGELGYTISIKGFSAPTNIGGIGDLLGGATNALPLPTTVTASGKVDDFPAIETLTPLFTSKKMIYTDSETVDLDGTKVEITTSTDYTGTVTYGPQSAHMYTTLPDKDEKIPEGTSEVVTYFAGHHLSTFPVKVTHDWSDGPVCITTNKYIDSNPGYHAIVCNGCGLSSKAEMHRPEIVRDDAGNPVYDENGKEIQIWTSNEDASFVGNGTASSTCQDCHATLTKDVHGTAGFNSAFANYHFLLVVFEYINLILRFIGAAVD